MSAKKTSSRAKRKPARKPNTKRAVPASKADAQSGAEAATAKRGRGRPSDFKPEYCRQAEKLCKLGATDVEIADFFGKAQSTIDLWKLKHPEFSESLKRGKMLADANVANRLYQRATGYRHRAVKIMQFEGEVFREEYTEHYAPDTAAAIFWLCNRQKDKWRQRQEITGANGKPLAGDVNLDEVRDAINSKFDRIAATLAAAGVPQQS